MKAGASLYAAAKGGKRKIRIDTYDLSRHVGMRRRE